MPSFSLSSPQPLLPLKPLRPLSLKPLIWPPFSSDLKSNDTRDNYFPPVIIDLPNRNYSPSLPLKTRKIPRIIIQTVKSKTNIPCQWLPSQRSIREIMSHWEHKIFDDHDNRELVKEICPEYLSYYDNFPYPIQRVDFVRAVYMIKYGGVYMDMDFEVLKPLDSLFENDADLYFVRSGNVGTYLTNSLMASAPGHPFWRQYLKEMTESVPLWGNFSKHLTIMSSTGPLRLTWTVKKYKPDFSYMPNKLVMPCSVCDVGKCDVSQSLLSPLKGQSWCSWDSHLLNFLLCNWRKIVVYLTFFILFAILIFILWKKGKLKFK